MAAPRPALATSAVARAPAPGQLTREYPKSDATATPAARARRAGPPTAQGLVARARLRASGTRARGETPDEPARAQELREVAPGAARPSDQVQPQPRPPLSSPWAATRDRAGRSVP